MTNIAIIGCGGHSKVVSSIAKQIGYKILAYTSDAPSLVADCGTGCPVMTDEQLRQNFAPDEIKLILGIGGVAPLCQNNFKQEIIKRYISKGYSFLGLQHPSAIVSTESSVSSLAQLHAGCIIQPNVTVGDYAIINSGVIAEHDCVIGDFCHIAPGCCLSGNVTIGERSHIGAGATIIQGIRIGNEVLVAAGAIVTKDVPEGSRVKGVPAKPF